jgi:Domain of unknown function (DUF5060)/Putative collagen-binding domain of a collagenase
MAVRFLLLFALSACAVAQTVCPATPQYSPCDIVFDIPSANGDQATDLEGEFRSPKQNTALVHAFWDGGTRWVIRYTPAEAGTYAYRITSKLPGIGGKTGDFAATAVAKPGWLRAANVHHFAAVEGTTLSPHLWMGAVVPGFPSMDAARWKSLVDARAAQHFNHLGVTLVEGQEDFRSPAFFNGAEEKIRYANGHGIIVDIAFFGPDGLINKLLPSRETRSKWFAYAISRLAAFDVTWQGLEAWESYDNGREVLKEIADYLGQLDPYKHPRSTRASISSGGLSDDGWLRYRSYQTGDDAVGEVDQQIYQYPSVNNFGAGVSDTDTFRHRLWNSAMNGQYPDTEVPNEQAAAEMKIWYEFMDASRHWETEPFFDADGYRGLALDGIEYVIYLEKPGPITVHLEDHRYDGAWFNPVNGQFVKIKEVKGETFTGEPPDKSHDWALRISREGTKAGMLKSVKFDSRIQGIEMQVVEGNPDKVPFEVVEPAADSLSLGKDVVFSVKLKRETKALKNMLYEWTGEVTLDGRGPRVIATGSGGTFHIPANIARDFPAGLHVKVTAVNGLGKAYTLDRNYTLNK